MNEFMALVREVWADSTFGVSPAELLTALAVFLVFAILRGLFTRFALGGLERLTKKEILNHKEYLKNHLKKNYF